MTMNRILLNGPWRLTYGPQRAICAAKPADLPPGDWMTIDATVPGAVELDLMEAAVIDDLTVGARVEEIRRFETYEWWFARDFETPDIEVGERVELVFEGLDTFASVWLNGDYLGGADNMLIAHRFDVTNRLRHGAVNHLTIQIRSATLEGRARELEPIQFILPWRAEGVGLRKASHMYGWDIMPRLVSAGIWRDVALEVTPPSRWRSIYWTTLEAAPQTKRARLRVDWSFDTDRREIDDLRVRATISSDEWTVHSEEFITIGVHGRATLNLKDIDLWWPRGYGAPALYDARLDLVDGEGTILDSRSCRIGLRIVELRHTDISTLEQPGEFVFLVNGERVFVRGANWTPLDALHARDPQHLPAACEMLSDLNCNMARCWGGGVYEDHAFFDFCDENGVLVWQDFAYACDMPPQTDEFAAIARHEAEAVVKKLRNHPSLAVWVGGNEVDSLSSRAGVGLDPNDEKISREVLPAVVRRLDPLRPYLPNSPYHSPEANRLGNQRALLPEVHLWGKRGFFKDEFYTNQPAQFIGEVGYHGCPSRKSMEQFLDAEHVWPWQRNDQWLAKASRPYPNIDRCDYRIPLMAEQIARFFEEAPDELDDFILASQITQAEADKFFVEWARQGKWRRTGVLWWNLRDGWPLFSDAVVDYYGRRKLAYWYLKRSQATVCAIVGEAEAGRHPLIIANDSRLPHVGHVVVRNADTDDFLLEKEFLVDPNDATIVEYLPRPIGQEMWLLSWTIGESLYQSHYLAGDPPFSLRQYRRWLDRLDIPTEDRGEGQG